MVTNHEGHPSAVRMTEACTSFLQSLSQEQRAKGTFRYEDGERVLWYYPPLNRHGLSLKRMNADQRELAYAILAAGLGEEAYGKARQIIDHEAVLGPLEVEKNIVTWDRDPALYYFSVFGEPGGQDPWAWRAEGHHVSLHFSIWGDKVISMTPLFFGANPAEVRNGPKTGLRILGVSEDLAIDLMDSLDSGQRQKAMIYNAAPLDIITFNSTRVSLPPEEGLPASQMSGTQKEILMALVVEYVTRVSPELAKEKLEALKGEGFDNLHWAWGGPVNRIDPHYYRIHGGNFVVEFDNRQDGANHIHSVLRDVENDFATDVLREHLLVYHLLDD